MNLFSGQMWRSNATREDRLQDTVQPATYLHATVAYHATITPSISIYYQFAMRNLLKQQQTMILLLLKGGAKQTY